MAYAATTNVEKRTISGRRHYIVTISESDASATDEWSVDGLPNIGTILLYQATLESGTGTTIQPKLGKVTGWTQATQDDITEQASAAAHVKDQTPVRYVLEAGHQLFGISTVDAGADNVVETVLVIAEGHGGQ